MARGNWEDLGNTIKDVVEDAISHQDFTKLNQTVNNVINDATDSIRGAFRTGEDKRYHDEYQNQNRNQNKKQDTPQDIPQYTYKYAPKYKPAKNLYTSVLTLRGKGLAMTIVGFIFAGIFGVFLFVLLLALLTGIGLSHVFWIAVYAITPFFIGSMVCGGLGRRLLGRAKRFQQYLNGLGEKTYCNISQFAELTGKSSTFIKRDLRKMIQSGWFLEGHLDDENTCLMTNHMTFDEYQKLKRQKELISKEQIAPKPEPLKQAPTTEAEQVLREGEDYIRDIRKSNDAIHGIEISEKISRMELLIRRIFERIQDHPEQLDDIQKLMSYYLPTTVKLLHAYEELDAQPVQGENIRNSKREIEVTLDTLNYAFEQLLDNLFQDTAWDVSSDISVLHTILSQEGLTKNHFKREETK